MLTVGTDKSPILEHLPHNFLLIDDGPIIDALTFPKWRQITRFDYKTHSFNPLKNLDYRGARGFLSIINAIFPEGENTLTRKNANFVLLSALLQNPKALDTLLAPSNDPPVQDAYQKIQTLLLSPVLRNVLLKAANISFSKGILLARLPRSELGDFDAFVLGQFLIGLYQGHVVIPDYGFYACSFHATLFREKRISVGVNFLDEVPPEARRHLLLMDDKIPSHCTYDDAETLALYSGLLRDTVGFTSFVHAAIR